MSDRVETEVLVRRLNQLSDAVTKGRVGIEREFYMSIPARRDHDADLVLSEAADRILALETTLSDCVRHMKTAGDPRAAAAADAARKLLEVKR